MSKQASIYLFTCSLHTLPEEELNIRFVGGVLSRGFFFGLVGVEFRGWGIRYVA